MDLCNSFWCVIGHFEGDLDIRSILGYFVFRSQDYQAQGSSMVNTLNFYNCVFANYWSCVHIGHCVTLSEWPIDRYWILWFFFWVLCLMLALWICIYCAAIEIFPWSGAFKKRSQEQSSYTRLKRRPKTRYSWSFWSFWQGWQWW
jgi:hypothetical protein